MFKKNLWMGIAIVFIGTSIIFSGYFIGNAIKSVKMGDSDLIPAPIDNQVLNLSQTAKYLNMTEDEVQGIIQTEKASMEKIGSFSGKMFPYFTINNKKYFYKNEIDEWLKEVSSTRREYNTTEGWIFR